MKSSLRQGYEGSENLAGKSIVFKMLQIQKAIVDEACRGYHREMSIAAVISHDAGDKSNLYGMLTKMA